MVDCAPKTMFSNAVINVRIGTFYFLYRHNVSNHLVSFRY